MTNTVEEVWNWCLKVAKLKPVVVGFTILWFAFTVLFVYFSCHNGKSFDNTLFAAYIVVNVLSSSLFLALVL